ncbi:O-antigen polymerase [Myroides odoratimimus]|uniref:O-antigen polymerase n=1 Tax=Myroides odoratimimus TaxID=76832 RepID=UPI002DC02CAF|nr:O-antigen polymerase [Myroides odoratimimus]MEC4028768.1 O-antigen polymerase [Myroides odoratimimus]
MQKLFIFLVVFCYIYPVFLKFLPIPTDRVIQLIGVAVFVCDSGFWKRMLKHSYVVALLLGSSFFSVFVYLVQGWNEGIIDLYFFKINISVFFYFFSAYLIVYLLNKKYKSLAFIKLFDYLVYVGLFQCIISIVFFVKPAIFDMFSALIHNDANQNMLERIGLIEKRMIGIGSAFFTGVVKYGVTLFILICLYFTKGSRFYKNTLFFLVSSILFVFVGILTGRTFFVAIILGAFLYAYIDMKAFLRLIKYLPIIVLMLMLLYFILSFFINRDRLDNIVFFITEIFDNYQKTGKLSTTSSDATLEMYKFPENIKTWLFGDGKMLLNDGSYYMSTDVGYSRLIFYFGVPLTILYFVLQGYYLKLVSRLLSKEYYIVFNKLIKVIFLWLVLLNFKGLVHFYDYIVLLFMITLNNFIYERSNKINQ